MKDAFENHCDKTYKNTDKDGNKGEFVEKSLKITYPRCLILPWILIFGVFLGYLVGVLKMNICFLFVIGHVVYFMFKRRLINYQRSLDEIIRMGKYDGEKVLRNIEDEIIKDIENRIVEDIKNKTTECKDSINICGNCKNSNISCSKNNNNKYKEEDIEHVEWLNYIIRKIWYVSEEGLCSEIFATVNEALRQKTPKVLKRLRLTELTLGTRPPVIDKVAFFDIGDEKITVEFGMSFIPLYNDDILAYFNDLSNINFGKQWNTCIELTATVGFVDLPILVRNFLFTGRFRLEMLLSRKLPFLERVNVCLMETPTIDFELHPLKMPDLMDLPYLSWTIRRIIDSVLRSQLIFPNMLSIDTTRLAEYRGVMIGVICVGLGRLKTCDEHFVHVELGLVDHMETIEDKLGKDSLIDKNFEDNDLISNADDNKSNPVDYTVGNNAIVSDNTPNNNIDKTNNKVQAASNKSLGKIFGVTSALKGQYPRFNERFHEIINDTTRFVDVTLVTTVDRYTGRLYLRNLNKHWYTEQLHCSSLNGRKFIDISAWFYRIVPWKTRDAIFTLNIVSVTGLQGLEDPPNRVYSTYCHISIETSHRLVEGTVLKVFETRRIFSTKDPIYNDTFKFFLNNYPSNVIKIRIMNEHNNKEIGRVLVFPTTIDSEVPMVYKISNVKYGDLEIFCKIDYVDMRERDNEISVRSADNLYISPNDNSLETKVTTENTFTDNNKKDNVKSVIKKSIIDDDNLKSDIEDDSLKSDIEDDSLKSDIDDDNLKSDIDDDNLKSDIKKSIIDHNSKSDDQNDSNDLKKLYKEVIDKYELLGGFVSFRNMNSTNASKLKLIKKNNEESKNNVKDDSIPLNIGIYNRDRLHFNKFINYRWAWKISVRDISEDGLFYMVIETDEMNWKMPAFSTDLPIEAFVIVPVANDHAVKIRLFKMFETGDFLVSEEKYDMTNTKVVFGDIHVVLEAEREDLEVCQNSDNNLNYKVVQFFLSKFLHSNADSKVLPNNKDYKNIHKNIPGIEKIDNYHIDNKCISKNFIIEINTDYGIITQKIHWVGTVTCGENPLTCTIREGNNKIATFQLPLRMCSEKFQLTEDISCILNVDVRTCNFTQYPWSTRGTLDVYIIKVVNIPQGFLYNSYLKIYCNDQKIFKTEKKFNSQNPIYNETFKISVEKEIDVLSFYLNNYSAIASSTVIGYAEMPLFNILPGYTKYNIELKDHLKNKPSGIILQLIVNFTV